MRAEVQLSLSALYGFLLVLARVGGACVFVPIPGIRNGAEPVRAVLALALAVALFPAWPRIQEAPGAGQLAVWAIAEAAFGIAIGVAVAFLTEGLAVATQVLGLQAGYSYASTIDPSTQADSSVLQVFAQLIAGLLFFTLELDRHVIRVFAKSLETVPPGSYLAGLPAGGVLIQLGAGMFSTGLRLAMPVIALLVLVDVALALLGRVNAQLQLLMLAFPVKMLAALALLAAVSPLFVTVYRGAAERTMAGVSALLSIR